MSNADARHLDFGRARAWQALVLGRAGLDLYPEPAGCKIQDAVSFSCDMGGSAGNIAVAMAKAGARVGLISALSDDGVGRFVRTRLRQAGVDISLTSITSGDERTSLALAEIRSNDCEVVIYRNNAADLKLQYDDNTRRAIQNASNLVVTGTSLIDPESRYHTLAMMELANASNCPVWLDLDYRPWNWPSLEITRDVYHEAAALSRVMVGNRGEFAVLTDNLESQIEQCRQRDQIMVLKRGAEGASLYLGKTRLDAGIYPLDAIKPYGSGDAFLGNLLVNYMHSGDWREAVEAGSAAAALVVSRRGCADAMPTPDELTDLQRGQTLYPAATWS